MKSTPKLNVFCIWPLLAFILLTTCGCISPQGTGNIADIEEEAYIDLKQMFSLVVPALWLRERVPVSSPRFSIDTVDWTIPSPEGPNSSLQIRSLVITNASTFNETFVNYVRKDIQSETIEPLSFQHPAGPALRLDLKSPAEKTIYLAIEGSERIYLMKYRMTNNLSAQLLPVIERVILSFSILAD